MINEQLTWIVLLAIVIVFEGIVPVNGNWGSQTLRSGEVLKFAQFCIKYWIFFDHDGQRMKATAGIQPETSYGYVYHNYQESLKKAPKYYKCGDCDDFAVMLAYKIKQFFPGIVDTKVALYKNPSGGQSGHAVCLIGIDPLTLGIGYQIYYNGKTWSAIDMGMNGGIYHICPDYARAPPSVMYNPEELMGNTVL